MASERRSDYWDNAKGLLIVLVVLGHLFEKNCNVNLVFQSIHDVIYSFHMPAFIMISGYFSKNHSGDAVKAFKNLLIPYFFLNLIAGSLILRKVIWNPFVSYYGYWYLLCLYCWRISYNGFIKTRAPLVISIAISIISGLWIGNGFLGGQDYFRFCHFL